MAMLIMSFLSWWYGRGWEQAAFSFGRRAGGVIDAFSVGQLSRTMFAPWRRIITYPGDSLGDRVRAWGDNMFSRAIGFVVRLLVLLTAGLTLLVVMLLTLVEVGIWPLLPLAVPACLIAGIIG